MTVTSLGGAWALTSYNRSSDTAFIVGKLSTDYCTAGSHGMRVCTAIINTQFAKRKNNLKLTSSGG